MLLMVMADQKLILCVRENKNGQKTITIPKEDSIKKGDYVEIRKVIFN